MHKIFKIMVIEYLSFQTTGEMSQAITKVACEKYNEKLSMSCTGSNILTILKVNYGRTDKDKCGGGKNTNCKSPNSMEKASICNGLNSCQLRASNTYFGDPCPRVYKYLEVTYGCLDGNGNPAK